MKDNMFQIGWLAVKATVEIDVLTTSSYGDLTLLAVQVAFWRIKEVSPHSSDQYCIDSYPEMILALLDCEIIGGENGLVIGLNTEALRLFKKHNYLLLSIEGFSQLHTVV